ncbi:uncharacterized protein F4822DRAFT_439643 [Hypoxylon trugodes]|uniref:uncharacterized protein n=1 Tax=Hypoxylon trugodes TaxID=326681 RepID=UPI00219DD789|nr:uncharacterized protein F4822DRAFT_439643 [Hypoxylon trugodes]KAI1393680.1 hypothetical protein F4822DRAFT_439643 [Hypoxylon trugodes]
MGLTDFFWKLSAITLLLFLYPAKAIVDDCNGVLVSDTLPVLVNYGTLLEHLQALQNIADENGGSRVTGSEGHNQTIEYIQDQLTSLGYYVEVQRFEGLMQVEGHASVAVNGDLFDVEPIGWSPNGNFSDRPLIPVNGAGCRAVDYPQEALDSIVLVAGGECSASDKSIAAGKAGAKAILLHESTQLTPSMGGLDDRHIPSAIISEKDAHQIRSTNNPLWANILEIKTQYTTVSSYNVFAT